MSSSFLGSKPASSRQVRQHANPEDYLSYELGKAVQELPPLYTRLLAGGISFLVFGAIAWANFSQVEEVASSRGELIASTQVQPVRSLSSGTVRAVRVKQGDRIHKGDILVEGDPVPPVEVDRLMKSAQLIREELKRLEAEWTGAATTGSKLQDQLLTFRLQDFKARRAAAVAEAYRQVAVINEAKVSLAGLQENLANAKINVANAKTNQVNAESILVNTKSMLAVAQKREEGLRSLQIVGAASRLDYLDAQNGVTQAQASVTRSENEITNAQNKVTEALDKVTSIEKEMAAQVQKIRQAEQAYQAARAQTSQLDYQRQSEILTTLSKRREEYTKIAGQLEQAQRELKTIVAPVSGTIYSVKATEGPVQTGEELLSILPDGEELLLEVKVLNRDIGFVREGMKAKVKMAAFPFQEFAKVDGEVVKVSPNPIFDKELGLVFSTKIKLNKDSIQVRGQDVQLTPGMTAIGEIVTRQESILTFLIEPVTSRFSSAFSIR